MKKLFVLATLFALAITPAFAAQYVTGKLGTNFLHQTKEHNDPKIGYQVGGAWGYYFGSGIRTECEFNFKENEYSKRYAGIGVEANSETKRSLHSWILMGNAIYDVAALELMDIVPYVGFGVGYAHNVEKVKIKSDAISISDKMEDDRIAYQLIAGAKYPLSEKVHAGFEYKYCVSRTHAKDHHFGVSLTRNF